MKAKTLKRIGQQMKSHALFDKPVLQNVVIEKDTALYCDGLKLVRIDHDIEVSKPLYVNYLETQKLLLAPDSKITSGNIDQIMNLSVKKDIVQEVESSDDLNGQYPDVKGIEKSTSEMATIKTIRLNTKLLKQVCDIIESESEVNPGKTTIELHVKEEKNVAVQFTSECGVSGLIMPCRSKE